jgi:hypothetical protein
MDDIQINCPFCDTPIKAIHKPHLIREIKRTSWGGNKPSFARDKEVIIIMVDTCPKCGKTKKEIEKSLEKGKELSNEEVLRRLKEAGLDPRRLK